MVVRDEAALDDLRRRLGRFPPDRYPVQHATTQFHLGAALLDGGRAHDAVAALRTSVGLFRPEHLPVEHAKAANLLGAALRAIGDPASAAGAFGRAVTLFEAAELPLERAAAGFNLGLAQRDTGDDAGAARSFATALETFESAGAAAQSSAAARELGAALLDLSDVDGAVELLERSVRHADRAGDLAGRGVALNALGLGYLAAERPDEARHAFEDAAAAHPRSLRPEFHAVAKTNLALAAEAGGDEGLARLTARQARDVANAPAVIVDRAAAILDRLGEDAGALHAALDGERREDRWIAVLRDELTWLVEAPKAERARGIGAWIDGLAARPGEAEARVYCWMSVLLELPPPGMETLLEDSLRLLPDRDAETRELVDDAVERSMVRFGGPQFLRVKEALNGISEGLGQPPAWG
jgi:tetratricopeptide (TPR) repeat protein